MYAVGGKSLKRIALALNAIILKSICRKIDLFALFEAHTPIHHYIFSKYKLLQNKILLYEVKWKKVGTTARKAPPPPVLWQENAANRKC